MATLTRKRRNRRRYAHQASQNWATKRQAVDENMVFGGTANEPEEHTILQGWCLTPSLSLESDAQVHYKLLCKVTARQKTVKHDLRYHEETAQQLWSEQQKLPSLVQNSVFHYAIFGCRALAAKLYETLPRELRDMVYECSWADYLSDDSKNGAFQLARTLQKTPWLSKCIKPCDCFRRPDLEGRNIFVYPGFVGREVAIEAAIAYYRIMPANRLGQNNDQLGRFLTVDHFHLGLIPADYIRRLYIHIRSSALDTWNELIGVNTTYKNIAALLRLKLKKGFRLHVNIMDSCGNSPDVVMECFNLVYHDLVNSGATVTMHVATQKRRHVVDVTEYYKMPRDEWKKYWQAIKDLDDASSSSDSSDSNESDSDSSDDSSSDDSSSDSSSSDSSSSDNSSSDSSSDESE